jgi:hypothetical protein
MSRSINRFGAVGLVMGMAACGGSSTPVTPSSPSPTPPPAPVTTVLYQNSGPIPVNNAVMLDFVIPNAGTVAATVDWTFASNLVIAAVTTQACNDLQSAFLGTCAQIGTPQLDSRKPKTVSGSAQAGGARFWLANLGPTDESAAVQVTLTRVPGAAAVTSARQSGAMVSVPLSSSLAARLRGR